MFENLKEYDLIKVEELKSLQSKGMLLIHKKSKARICLISNDDTNKVFTVGFRTPPTSNCGTPHIIEHSVLCGSKKFPLKDPFIELVKGSLNTFLNAMTYPDKTLYPVASYNDKDFLNLMDVYMDAVFNPNILKRAEIFKQEGWHYEIDDDDNLSINGVVYNEMKGAYSTAEEVLFRRIHRSLFPDTAYGKDSGGDPDEIYNLTYEDFIDFYKKYYHPSNSYIYLYGDMDMEEKLRWLDTNYLSNFDAIELDSEVKSQAAYEKMKDVTEYYGIVKDDTTVDKTYLSYNAVIGTSLDKELYLAFDILDYALISAQGAPLSKALLDAGIGKDVSASFDNGIKQPVFSIIATNTNEDRKDEFISIIKDTLKKQVEEGIDKKALEAAINSAEFRFREADFGHYPKGLMWGLQMFDSWLYDDNEPFIHLDAINTYDFLRKQIGTHYFEDLIEKYLLNNNHSSLVTLVPKPGLGEERDAALKNKLEEYKKSLSDKQINKIKEDMISLKEYQTTPNTKEEMLSIPLLKRSDLKKEPEPFINEISSIGDVKVVSHNIFTQGITYFKVLFDVTDASDELLFYIGLLKDMLSFVDTKDYTYSELTNEIDLRMGGYNNNVSLIKDSIEEDKYSIFFTISIKCFSDKFKTAVDLLCHILGTSDLTNEKRIRELISQEFTRSQYSLLSSGNATASFRTLSYFDKAMQRFDKAQGLGFYRFIEECEMNFENNKAQIIDGLKQALMFVLSSAKVIFSITAEDKDIKNSFEQMNQVASLIKNTKREDINIPKFKYDIGKNEGFKSSSQIQFVCRGGNFKKAGFDYNGTFVVLRNILNFEYLWNNVRVLGGAYGCGCSFTLHGNTTFSSYRDPNLKNTLDIYEGIPDYIEKFDVDERDMTKYIIGAISEIDNPLTPFAKGERSLRAYINRRSIEEIKKTRKQILEAQPSDIRALSGAIKSVMDQNYICVIGNEQKIEEASEVFDMTDNLFKI